MTAEPIDTIPIQDVLPKRRGPGRPSNVERGLPPPQRSTRRPSKRSARRSAPVRKPSTRSLKPEIAAFLTMVNQLALMSPIGTRPFAAAIDPTIPAERVGDELDSAEIAALAGAIDAQAMRSPRFRKYVERMLGVGAGGQLIGVLSIIAVRRAARHGVAPPMLDPILGAQLAGMPIEEFGGLETRDDAPDPTTGEVPPDRAMTDSGVDFDALGGMEP